MTSFLEQMQATLRQLESRVKYIERRLSSLEDILKNEHKKDSGTKKELTVKKKSKPFNLKRFELNIGKYFLQIVGVGIFLVGMGFLLKFSIEKDWLQPLVRIVLCFASATVAIFLGEYWRIHYKQWAAGCIAGGIVLFYLTFYAAFTIYHIFSVQQAFSGFIVTTLFAALLALWHKSYFIALFSVVGGYATPLVLHLEEFNLVFLSGYLLVLGICYLFLSYAKRWFIISYVSLGCTMLYFSHILFSRFTINQKLAFLTFSWLIYSFLPYIFAWFNRSKKERFTSLLLVASSIFVFFGLFYSLIQEPLIESTVWPFALLLKGLTALEIFSDLSFFFSLVNGILFLSLYLWNSTKAYLLGALYTLFVVHSIGFIIIQWSGYSAIAILSLFALLLFAFSFLTKQVFMRIYPYIIWVFCSWRMFTLLYYQRRPLSLILNEINVSLFIIALTFVFAYWLSFRYRNQLKKNKLVPLTLFEGIVLALPIYWVHTQVWKFPYHILGLLWYGLFLFLWGLIKKQNLIRQFGYTAGFLGTFYFSFHYFMNNLLNPYWIIWLNILFLSFVLVFLIALILLCSLPHKLPKKEFNIMQNCLEFLLAFFVFAWIRANIILYFDTLKMESAFFIKHFVGYSVKNDILVRQSFTNTLLALFYTAYSVFLISIGLITKKRIVRYLGLITMAIALLKLSFVVLRMSDNIYRIITFLIIGILLIIVSFLYQRMSKKL